MRIQDEVILALTLWRENRCGGAPGMKSVANVILNRSAKHHLTVYEVCVLPLQFSSMTAKGDPELNLWPNDGDAQWQVALGIAALASGGVMDDVTNGATLYYAPKDQPWKKRWTLPNGESVVFPDGWNQAVVGFTGEIAGQLFFREV